MATLPYDVLYQIGQDVAVPVQRSSPRDLFPFDHPALLSQPTSDQATPKNLRACALVCSAWSTPMSTVNIRLLHMGRARLDVLSNALRGSERGHTVQELVFGHQYCADCWSAELREIGDVVCQNGTSLQTLLATIERCPGARRLVIHEYWDPAGNDSRLVVSSLTARAFTSITEFNLASSHLDKRVPLRSLCHLLVCLPGLKRLALGDISGTDDVIDDIPSPLFQLESLAVSDARGIDFCNYEWLLRNSSTNLVTFWVYGVFGDMACQSVLDGLAIVRGSLRYLFAGIHLNPDRLRQLHDTISACHNLEEFMTVDLTCIHDGHLVPTAHPTLRRLMLAPLSSRMIPDETGRVPEEWDETRECVHFYDGSELESLVCLLSERAFPRLETLTIRAFRHTQIVNPPLQQLRELQRACKERVIEFQFERMAELEQETSAA